jgi:hypothetical protein
MLRTIIFRRAGYSVVSNSQGRECEHEAILANAAANGMPTLFRVRRTGMRAQSSVYHLGEYNVVSVSQKYRADNSDSDPGLSM